MRLSVLPMVRRPHRKHSTGSRPLMPPNSIVSRIRLAAWGTFIHSFTGSSHKRLYPYGLNIFTFWGRIITPRPYGIYKSKKYYGRAYSILFNYCLRPVLSSETAECNTTLANINYVGSCCSSQASLVIALLYSLCIQLLQLNISTTARLVQPGGPYLDVRVCVEYHLFSFRRIHYVSVETFDK